MALKKDKTKILLPRREVLLKGGLGVRMEWLSERQLFLSRELGQWILQRFSPVLTKFAWPTGTQTMRLNGLGDSLNSKVFMKNMG